MGLSAAVEAGADYAVFGPENVVVHIPDPSGRNVFSGEILWTNGHDADNSQFGAGILPGLVAKFERSLIGTDHYSQLRASIVANTPGEGDDKGDLSVVFASNFTIKFFDTEEPRLSYGPNDWSTKPPLFFRFTKLGTYTVDLSMGALYDSDPNDMTPPSDPDDLYSDTATYTFHVGPIAELEVRGGGASSHVPADRNALSIVAVNNGPDELPGGARVTGLPKGAQVFHVSHGNYNGSTGVWNIGELRFRDYYLSAGESEPTLVLGASAGDTASVSIAGTRNYEVCIDNDGSDLAHTTQATCEAVTGASWHTGSVYDHKPANNTATITSARGTGGLGTDVPANPRTQTGTTSVMWDEVESVHGLPVDCYQVQWLGSDWTTLDDCVTVDHYVDAAPSGRRDYRVRAVNMAGASGPWSRSTVTVQAGHAGPPLNLRTQADGNNAIDVSWDAPEDAGGSAVTGYTVHWSADGTEGSWRNAGSTAEQTFKQRGLQTGAIRWYRAAARNRSGLGLWSDPVMGQTVSGAPDAPTLRATTLSDYEIELAWTVPKDNGQPITGYRIEHSPDGSAGSWQTLAGVSSDLTGYTDSTLPANTRRYYRIRAVNSVGNGAWSRTVSAITQLTPPLLPL